MTEIAIPIEYEIPLAFRSYDLEFELLSLFSGFI